MRIEYSIVIVGFALVGTLFSISDAYGAGFIKFDGIDGESQDKDHKGWSEIISLDENFETSSSASQRSGYASSDEIVITKKLDRAGPQLAQSVATGKVFPQVLIELCTESKTDCYLSYELSNVIITSYVIASESDDTPTEEISLNFEKITRNGQTQTKDKTASDVRKESTTQTSKSQEDKSEDVKSIKKARKVPEWVETTAKFWVDKDVSDREFTDALGFLVKEKIIDVQVESESTEKAAPEDTAPQVPQWIAQTTDWWINGQVPEDQFLDGIKWMIKNKIIRGI